MNISKEKIYKLETPCGAIKITDGNGKNIPFVIVKNQDPWYSKNNYTVCYGLKNEKGYELDYESAVEFWAT